jgi:arylformamidase
VLRKKVKVCGMDEKIYLHYTKAELDRNFDQRIWAANAEEVIARCVARSRETRATLRHQADIGYGQSSMEVLDIFPASSVPAPINVFVHGGAWRTFTKNDVSFVAQPFVRAGVHTVILDFANLLSVRLPDMVAQVRRGIKWVHDNAARFGGDPRRIFISAHSSGSHLTAMSLMTDWRACGLPADAVKAALCLSGPYELEPVVLSSRGAYVHISADEIHELSPLRHAERVRCPVIIAYSERDTDEFQRQSRAFAAALERAGRLSSCIRLSGMNHFEAMESLGNPDGILVRSFLALLSGKSARAR